MTSIGKEIDLLMSIFILLRNDLRDCHFLPGGNIGCFAGGCILGRTGVS